MKRVQPVVLATLVVTAAIACNRSPAPVNQTTHADSPPPELTAATPAPVAGAHSDVAPDSVQGTPDVAAAVVRSYLTALRARDTLHQTAAWEPGTSEATGVRPLRDTTIAAFAVGTPGRIEAAAGSRYIEIPITLDLATPSPLRLHGDVTLRRAVVDGASAAQRHWRIMRVEWSAPTQRSSHSSDSTGRR